MKQGKTLQALGRELQRQRNNRQDFLADTGHSFFGDEERSSRFVFACLS